MIKSYFGYFSRKPVQEEILWFRENQNITGYASDDGCIVINPFSTLNKKEITSVCINEALRLFMRDHKINPKIKLTKKQTNFFIGTAYEGRIIETKQTIVARIIAGDPSAQDVTPTQRMVANVIYNLALENAKK
jgi:hypothetical protein